MQTATAAPSPAASTSTAEAEPPRLSPAAREHLAKLSEHANKAVRAADDKHGLAVTLYEMVRALPLALGFSLASQAANTD